MKGGPPPKKQAAHVVNVQDSELSAVVYAINHAPNQGRRSHAHNRDKPAQSST